MTNAAHTIDAEETAPEAGRREHIGRGVFLSRHRSHSRQSRSQGSLSAGNYLCRFRTAYSTTMPNAAPMAAPVRVLRVVGHGLPLSQCIRKLSQPIAPPTIAPMVPPVTPCGRPESDADFKCAPTRGTAENPSRAGTGSPLGATSEIFRPATGDRTLSCPERVWASAVPGLSNPRSMTHKNKDNLMDLPQCDA